MARLRILSGREACRILAENGFTEVRQRGSHVVMPRREGEKTITVPIPDHSELRIGTLTSIIRQPQLPRRLLETE
ncbi:MAG: type II toxin-antitoxin system HicA family toxin [Planctomycetota bacterium]